MNEEQTRLARELTEEARRRGVDLWRRGMFVALPSGRTLRLCFFWDNAWRALSALKPTEVVSHRSKEFMCPVITDVATVGCLLEVLWSLPRVVAVDGKPLKTKPMRGIRYFTAVAQLGPGGHAAQALAEELIEDLRFLPEVSP